ncbi:MAG: serine/threonine-protein kinase, partial [Candidatus Binatia bacterium]
LTHPNIVQIFDFGKIDDFYFIAMEYVPGQNLRSILTRATERRLPMPVDLACQIIARACAGLDNAHRKVDEQGNPLRIVHRDVSPQNVLVSYEGEVKVVDFGIAKAVAENSRATQGVLKGKFAYLSPEQVSGKKLDARSDVFAMGLVFYELLVGKKLFVQTNPAEILDAILHVDAEEVARSVPGLTRAVREIVRKSIAVDPAVRFESAAAMQRALEEHLRSASDVGGTLHIANYMRLLFDDHMGDQTAEALRVAVMGKKRRGLGDLFGAIPARGVAAVGGAVAGLVTLALVPSPVAKPDTKPPVEERAPGGVASVPDAEPAGDKQPEKPPAEPEPPPRDPG